MQQVEYKDGTTRQVFCEDLFTNEDSVKSYYRRDDIHFKRKLKTSIA